MISRIRRQDSHWTQSSHRWQNGLNKGRRTHLVYCTVISSMLVLPHLHVSLQFYTAVAEHRTVAFLHEVSETIWKPSNYLQWLWGQPLWLQSTSFSLWPFPHLSPLCLMIKSCVFSNYPLALLQSRSFPAHNNAGVAIYHSTEMTYSAAMAKAHKQRSENKVIWYFQQLLTSVDLNDL